MTSGVGWVDEALKWLGLLTAAGTLIAMLVGAVTKIRGFFNPTFGATLLLQDEENGNILTLANTSATPIMLDYWEIVWRKRKWLFWFDERHVEGPDYENGALTLPAHNRKALTFSGADYFSWGHEFKKFGSLYLKIAVTGRRGLRSMRLYSP